MRKIGRFEEKMRRENYEGKDESMRRKYGERKGTV